MNEQPPFQRVQALRYVTAANAPAYRAIMQVCSDALRRYRIELRSHDILRDLQEAGHALDIADVETLERQYLDQLVQWGNLAATADAAGVSRLEDFYRRRLVYHVTDVGEAAHRAVLDVEAAIGRSGSLQATMLVKIRDGSTPWRRPRAKRTPTRFSACCTTCTAPSTRSRTRPTGS